MTHGERNAKRDKRFEPLRSQYGGGGGIRTAYFTLVVLALLVVFLTAILVTWYKATVSSFIQVEEMMLTAPIQEPITQEPVTTIAPISCYTGVESHGANGRRDGVSVATHRYPQGTEIWIEGFGERRVDTVTARRYADRIDVWFGYDYEACIRFGVQEREVRVL